MTRPYCESTATSRREAVVLPAAALGHARGHGGAKVPKLREGSYFPALVEPRRRSERALLAVV